MIRLTSLSLIFSILSLGCGEDPFNSGGSFQITVTDDLGRPVDRAFVEGGADHTQFLEQTNIEGRAVIPKSALGGQAFIFKTDYLTLQVKELASKTYTLRETSKRLDLIGDVSGKAVRFRATELITLERDGSFHLYSFNDQSINEQYNQMLVDSTIVVKETKLKGDTLFFTTLNSGVYVFSITNPARPEFLFHLDIPRQLNPFAVNDSIIVVGDWWNPGELEIIRYYPTGEWHRVTITENYSMHELAFFENTLVILGNKENLLVILDISDLSSPNLIYREGDPAYVIGFLHERQAILIPRGESENGTSFSYRVIDLNHPLNPTEIQGFTADSRLIALATDESAYGQYHDHWWTISLMKKESLDRFQTIATFAEPEDTYHVGGTFPPYYIIGGRLWKIVER